MLSRLRPAPLTFLTVVIVGVVAFFATQRINGGAESDNGGPPDIAQGLEKIIQEAAKPPFVGDKLGLFIAGTSDPVLVPPRYVTAEDVCPPGAPHTLAPPEEVGGLALSFEVPAQYKPQPNDHDNGAVACAGRVYVAKQVFVQAGGGRAVVGRTSLNVTSGMHWPPDRVEIITLGGREAVLLEPVHPEGNEHGGTQTKILFPEPFGMTFVSTYDLRLVDVLTLGEAVAEAAR